MSNRILNKKSASEMLGLSIRRLDYMVLKRQIPFLKIGSSVRFRESELDEWLRILAKTSVDEAVTNLGKTR